MSGASRATFGSYRTALHARSINDTLFVAVALHKKPIEAVVDVPQVGHVILLF